jgi:hypothetical protein
VEKIVDTAGITGHEGDEVIAKLVADATADYFSILEGA